MKNNKHTRAALRMDNAQSDKTRLPDEPGTGRQRLRIVFIQAIRRNATLGHADSSKRDEVARQTPLAALKNSPQPFELSLNSTLSSDKHIRTSARSSLRRL